MPGAICPGRGCLPGVSTQSRGCLPGGCVCLPGKKGLPRGVSSGESAQGSVFLGVSAEEVGSAQGSGCVCVYLDVFPGLSAQGVCLEGVSGGVSPKGWCLSGGVRVSSGGVGGCLPGRCLSMGCLCLDGGFCTGEVSGQRHVCPEGCLPKAGVFLGAVCVCLPWGVC